MLKIRLVRIGRKNDPTFRVVVTEHTRGPKSGNYVEILGNYNPKVDNIVLEGERIKYWISKGAQVSDTVHNILVGQGIIEGKKVNVLPKKSPIVKDTKSETGDKSDTDVPEETPPKAPEETSTEKSSEETKDSVEVSVEDKQDNKQDNKIEEESKKEEKDKEQDKRQEEVEEKVEEKKEEESPEDEKKEV